LTRARIQRRSFLQGAASVTIVVANGEVWRAFSQSPPVYGQGPAFAPWKTWKQDAQDGPLALVRAAILSSNAFNSQPWLFRVSAASIELFADIRRNLGAFDPYLREMHFSLGCALENLLLTASASAYRVSLSISPGKLAVLSSQPEPKHIASIELSRGKPAPGELYDAIPNRHTNRDPFDPQKPLPADFLAALQRSAAIEKEVKLFLFTAEPQRKKLVDAVIASSSLMADPQVQSGLRPWFRATMEDLQKSPDGSYVGPGGPFKPSSLDQYAALMSSAPLFGLIAVRDRYDVPQTVRAGQLWQRAHLLATARGAAARPANGAVESIDHEKQLNQPPRTAEILAKIIGDALWQPTFMFYMGYATQPAPASARRAVQDVLV
jgi:hypothetical protein